ncbi:ComEA family DNA-binding protein [Streptomyces sp. RPT161]|uniref:ComEA family DNA-binding protein n=1 Tax=Streptomyces sp. RPT161 TaxID=3015993 RepID=UPI0022B93E36|nr:ComEA family DNA-binding protein [Streptomyces sp. RPT161]
MGTHTATANRRSDIGTVARARADALFDRPPPVRDPAVADPSPEPAPALADHPSRRASWRTAVFERLPVWVQLRCGMELRTVAALAGVLMLAAVFAVHHFWTGRPRTVQPPPVARAVTTPVGQVAGGSAMPTARPSAAEVVVDIAGKVREPGVRRLPAGSRVTDALKAAGGPLPGADTSGLNLARPLTDGEQVVVGQPGPPAEAAGARGGGAAQAAGTDGGPGAQLSLNTATAEQLDALPGVGPVLARRIVEYRTEHGGFTSVSQLRQVTGVGERRFQELQALVRP